MKILFCISQLDFADHIAIAYLSGVARDLGHERFLCILSSQSLPDMVAEIKPDVVAYSANIFGFEKLIAAHEEALKRRPFISIMGGPQPTFSPEIFDKSYPIDAYCVGEGDEAFRDFLICVQEGRSFDGVQNLVTKNARNPVRPLIRDLGTLPLPDRDLTLANSYLKDTPKKTFYMTRGCPFSCYYCANNYYHALYRGKGPIVRRFPVERMIKEMEHVRNNYRMDFVKIGDDLFAMKVDDWFREFVEEYPKRIGIPFNCYLRFDHVDEELLVLLKKAGCYSVNLSVDSVNPHVRNDILGRNMKDVDIVKNLKMIRKAGIHTLVNFMLAAPDSSLEDDLDTIRVAREADITYLAYTTTAPMRGTKLWDIVEARGYVDPETFIADMTGIARPSELSCFSDREKQVRFNIYLIGSIVAKLPRPFYDLGLLLIKSLPPNPLFRWAQRKWFAYSISKNVFKFDKAKA